MKTTTHDTFDDLPTNCRAAADRMENALKEEACGCGCRVANISTECCGKIDALEKEISKACGKDVILVAYQKA